MVAVPGTGSLSVTGPTGKGGAKLDNRISTVVSEHKRPPNPEVKAEFHSGTREDVLDPEGRNRVDSGNRVIRPGVITVVPTWGTSSSTEDSGQLRRRSEDRAASPSYAITGATTWGSKQVTEGPECWEARRGVELSLIHI